MVLIGLMAGMAVLAMGNADRSKQQQLEAERLAMLLELAEQEAMVRGEVVALELFSEGYRFLSLQKDEWLPETVDQLFKPRTLNARMQLSLKLDEKPVYLNKRPGFTVHPEPQIILTPDGASEVFQIGIAQHDSDSLYFVANTAEEGLTVANVAIKP